MTPRLKAVSGWMVKVLLCFTVISSPITHAEDVIFTPPVEDPKLPKRLKELHTISDAVDYKKGEQGIKQIRLQTLKQAAFSWGVQEGLYWRYQNIVASLDSQSLELHTVFSFNKFLVDGKMLMPSIIEADKVFEQTTESTVRTVNVSYTLDKPARLVPHPPTWREYLVRNIDKPQKPHDVIFPRTNEEKMAWVEALNKGWKEGCDQADDIFEIDLRRIQKDIEGMYRFRKLLAMGIVTMPRISSSSYSVIKLDDGKTLNINDVVYSITMQSNFTETDKWEPFFRLNNGNQK
jgi:defect in organelle trafficking protein DotC